MESTFGIFCQITFIYYGVYIWNSLSNNLELLWSPNLEYLPNYLEEYRNIISLREMIKKWEGFNVDCLGYLCYLKEILKTDQNVCFKRNQIVKFEKFNVIFENL